MPPSRRPRRREPVVRNRRQGNLQGDVVVRAHAWTSRAAVRRAATNRRVGRVARPRASHTAHGTRAGIWTLLAQLVAEWLLKLAQRVVVTARRVRAWGVPRVHGLHVWLYVWLPHRLRTIAAAARARRGVQSPWPHAESDDFEISQEDLGPAAEDGVPVFQAPGSGSLPGWTIHLSARARAWRGLLIATTVAVALFVVVGGPGSLLASVQQWAASFAPPRAVAAAPPQLNASFWVAHRVPYQALDARGIILAPSAASSDLAYACWVDHRASQTGAPQVNLYITPDGARSWQVLAVPPDQAGQCQPVADAADPAGALLVLKPSTADDCGAPWVYASTNQGATWLPVALPGSLVGTCDPTFFLSHGLIYAWSPAAQAQGGNAPAAQLVTSGDHGQSWRPAFGAAPAGATVSLVAARADGALLVLVSAPAAHPGTEPPRTLWCRATADGAWQTLAALPAGTSTAYAATGQPSGHGCAWGALYAAGLSASDDTVITRLEVSAGRGWQTVPSLPVVDSAANSPLTVDGSVLSVAPDDTLLVDIPYSGPGVGVTAGAATPAHTFWGWNPHTGRWLEDVHISPANSSIDGFVWDYSEKGVPRLICWVYTLDAGIPAFTGLYRAAFAAPSAPSQDAGDQRAPGL